MRDWVEWHQAYEDPASALSARLRSVRWHLSEATDQAGAGPVRLVSLGAAQGHDVIGVLEHHPRGDVERTAVAAPALCAAGATVIWTRHRRPPDITPRIRAWFTGAGFGEVAFDALDTSTLAAVGAAGSAMLRAPDCPRAAVHLPSDPHLSQPPSTRHLRDIQNGGDVRLSRGRLRPFARPVRPARCVLVTGVLLQWRAGFPGPARCGCWRC